jgi:acetyltransferase-like isoleucine patch superfamily enzyme
MKNLRAIVLQMLFMFLPWALRRRLLGAVFGYRLHPTSRIGFAVVYPSHLVMEEGARIGHGTVCRGIGLLQLGPYASIGAGNWIGGHPEGDTRYFQLEPERRSALLLGEHAAITTRHIIDATNTISIGRFTTVAGFRSQLLTHSIDLHSCRQSSGPILIGQYCFVGTAVVILKDAVIPDYCVLGAMSLLNSAHDEQYSLYGGVPARKIKTVSSGSLYFQRQEGVVR